MLGAKMALGRQRNLAFKGSDMAVSQGSCPGCGAPIGFAAGSSVSAVCKYCQTTVRRTDRGLENLGRVADLTDTPSLVAVGDTGTAAGQSFMVLGRVQLQHDLGGVWEEWYLGFANGQWGWLAYAQGVYMLTWKVEPPPPVPAMRQMRLEASVPLGPAGTFRVVELKQATIASAEGELPFAPRTGEARFYADLHGPRGGFATIDWGQGSGAVEVFVGYQLLESQLTITQQVERPQRDVKLEGLNCPGCGAPLKLHGGQRIERVACQHCGTVSESVSQQIIARQQAARSRPLIPLGSSGRIDNVEYTVIGFMERSTVIEGETYYWTEYLLLAPGLGFRWLVEDEATWRFVTPVNVAEIDLSRFPSQVGYGGRTYRMRNSNTACVTYVVGEFYWKVQVGETVQVMDFESGYNIISREVAGNEVHWSASPPIAWQTIAQAFGITADPPASGGWDEDGSSSATINGVPLRTVIILIVIVLFVLIMCGMCTGTCGGCGSVGYYGAGVRGVPAYGGGFSGGK